jgi:hypothetical protein
MAVAKKLSNANTSKFQQILAASGQDLIEEDHNLFTQELMMLCRII